MSEPRSRWALFDLIASQRRFIYLAIALLSAGGIWSAFLLPSAVYPELNFQRITVVAQGSSLSARQQVFAVTRPIEEAVSLVPGVTRVRSRSIRGASEVPVTFAEGTDMPYALQLVRTRVEQIRGDLPAGVDIEIERMKWPLPPDGFALTISETSVAMFSSSASSPGRLAKTSTGRPECGAGRSRSDVARGRGRRSDRFCRWRRVRA